jgi:hypothetical protein
MADDPITGMYEVLDAVKDMLKSADPAKREKLAKTLDAYHEDFPDEFHWAISAQSPALLHTLMISIDVACRSDEKAKPRSHIRLVDRKPEDNA